ncbi:MAG: transcription termination factor NusA [Deltaproteobacteria bacterium]|nr:transcription termination factor NusA [Deltaproteobacteria bacterium]
MASELMKVIDDIAREKGIEKSNIIAFIEEAILTSARKKFVGKDMVAKFNDSLGEVELFEYKKVVQKVENPDTEITIEEARKLDPEAMEGDELGIKISTQDLGRIGAQAVKQLLSQRVRDAEREKIYNDYKNRKDELITGEVRRIEHGDLIVDIGKTEAILPKKEQIPKEVFRPGDKIRAYIVDVLRISRGPQIILSRIHPGFLKKLFELEVPEIAEGVVHINAVAREPGVRAKIAVSSTDADVDPIGACVGMKGARVQNIVQELRGEKIDIIPYHPEAAKFVCNAIAPAQVLKVFVSEEEKRMDIVVPDDQLSLAIGRKGQNVRLAVQLTGWKLDVMSEEKFSEYRKEIVQSFLKIEGINDVIAELLFTEGCRKYSDVAEFTPKELSELSSGLITQKQAKQIIANAKALAEQEGLSKDSSNKK